jgi:hypothetical protein
MNEAIVNNEAKDDNRIIRLSYSTWVWTFHQGKSMLRDRICILQLMDNPVV